MKQIVDKMAENFGFTKKLTDAIVRNVLELIQEKTITDGKVRTPFGTFNLKTRKATTARVPKTGEPIQVPERKTITFSASKSAKLAANIYE